MLLLPSNVELNIGDVIFMSYTGASALRKNKSG